MRIVFDTNVLARSHQKAHGPARRALLRVAAGPDALILSRYLLQELERLLTYPRLSQRSGLTSLDIAEYVEFLARAGTLVDPAPLPEDILRDPADVPVLGTAFGGAAECTRDADFFEDAAQRVTAARGIRILTDLELLQVLGIKSSPGP